MFMHRLTQAILTAGAKDMEGTFRLPGNKIQVDLLIEEIHRGIEHFDDVELSNFASLFKRWLAELPEPIVPMAMYDQLIDALDKNVVMDFIETLPRVHHDTLAYLVGFLQEYIKAEETTKMGVIPVAMIFGANVVRIVSNDQNVLKNVALYGWDFMVKIITTWDVQFIYPLPLPAC